MYLIAHHILSPLGNGTEANWQAILAGKTAIRRYDGRWASVEPFCASLFKEYPVVHDAAGVPYSAFLSLCIRSAEAAIADSKLDTTSSDVVFILSTTKGDNLDLLTPAKTLAAYFRNPNSPIAVSNACTSGVSAQVVAWRLLHTRRYKHAVIVGCDVQTRFIVSGFQSFKALSPEPCRPFDKARCGLNAGEAVATMVFSTERPDTAVQPWILAAGSIHNDANHISGPSRTGEGSKLCLDDVKGNHTALVCVHGTATVYNDEMESIALHRAGLDAVPVLALKSYYGHTMGAAGIVETILAAKAMDEGVVPACLGYDECGTTYPLQVANALQPVQKGDFVKLLSGFGGCNAAVRFTRQPRQVPTVQDAASRAVCEITIRDDENITALYRRHIGDYPKFFKMDTLAKLGIVGTEMLMQQCREQHLPMPGNPALVFGNRSASIANDTDYLATISDPDNYYPSPALFVYTLPNIVTGEIAIRHKWYGETCFYILSEEAQLLDIARATLSTTQHDCAIVGWVECQSKTNYFAHIQLLWKN